MIPSLPLGADADTTMLTGNGLNSTGGPIDRVAPGGAWQKERGTTTWTFVPSKVTGDRAKRRREYLDKLMREHGDESRELVVAVRDTSDVRKLRLMGLFVPSALPCSLTARVRYRQLPELKTAGLQFWNSSSGRPAFEVGDMRSISGERGRIARPHGINATLACSVSMPFSDGFEQYSIPGAHWTATNYSPYTSTYWGTGVSGCDIVRTGSCDASAGGSGGPCSGYDNGEDTDLELCDFLDMSAYSQYTVTYWVYISTVYDSDYLYGDYDNGDGYHNNVTYTGSSGTWVQQTLTFPNSSHGYDRLRLRFTFTSGLEDITGYAGAYIDDISITGTLFKPNLTYYTPSGWSSPVVPSSVTGTNTYGPLYAAPEATYIDAAVVNNGASTSGPCTVDFYLDGLIWLASVPLGSLAPGQAATFQDIANNAAISAGAHYIRMRIDVGNAVDEQSEDDNTFYSTTLTWNPARKDILIDQVTVTPSIPLVGQNVDIAVTLRNAGPTDITSNFFLDFYRNRVSPPSLGTVGDQSQLVYEPFYAGTTRTLHFFDAAASPTTWSSYVFADRNGDVAESDETNNIAGPISIQWSSGNVTVVGRLVFDDSLAGADRPIRCATVKIYDEDPLLPAHPGDPDPDDDLLATTWTDESGQMHPVTLVNRDEDQDQGLLDLYVVAECSTSLSCRPTQAVLMRNAVGGTWSSRSSTVTNAANGTLNFGTLKPTDSPARRALHVYHTLLRGYDWVISQGNVPSALSCIWFPGDNDPTQYDPTLGQININSHFGQATDQEYYGPDEYDDFPILHEYGHHVANVFKTAPQVSGCHGGLQFESDLCSMAEGWADWFASQMIRSTPTPILRDWNQNTAALSDTSVLLRNLETGLIVFRDGTYWYGNSTGEKYIPGVFSSLWDISDAANDNQPGPCADEMSDPVSRTWQAGVIHPNSPMNTLCDFGNVYVRTFLLNDMATSRHFNNTLCEHGVTCGGLLAVTPDNGGDSPWLGAPWPNPTRGATAMRLRLPTSALGRYSSVNVYDIAGAHVRTLFAGSLATSDLELTWDGRTDRGDPCRGGIYFVRLRAGGADLTTTLVRVE